MQRFADNFRSYCSITYLRDDANLFFQCSLCQFLCFLNDTKTSVSTKQA